MQKQYGTSNGYSKWTHLICRKGADEAVLDQATRFYHRRSPNDGPDHSGAGLEGVTTLSH